MDCYFCHFPFNTKVKVGFREVCGKCGRDLHICMNCSFYDTTAYNECKETQAERVIEKDKANFCEYFLPRENPLAGGGIDPAAEAKKKLQDLFKK